LLLALVPLAAVCEAQGSEAEPSKPRTIILSVRPSFDIPVAHNALVFTPAGGIAASGSYVLPFFRFVSVGMDLGYHIVPLNEEPISLSSSVSILSASVLSDFRVTFLRRFEVCVFLMGGYYFALLNDEPASTGHNFYTAGGVALSFLATRQLSIGVQSAYQGFLGLFTPIAVGLSFDYRLRR
jgi:hypothetical protein